MIAALLGALIELAGYRPVFAEPGEAPDSAVTRLRAQLILLDCDHACANGEAVYRSAAGAGSRLMMFGSTLNAGETERFAVRRGARWLSLPIGYHAFAERVREVLAPAVAAAPTRRASAEALGEATP